MRHHRIQDVLSRAASGALLAAAATLLGSCNAPTSQPEPRGGEYVGVVSVALVQDLPACGENKRGIVYYVDATDELVYCDGAEHLPLVLEGTADATWIIATEDASTEQCELGGVSILAGPDLDGDHVLDAAEVAQVVPICEVAAAEPCKVVSKGDGIQVNVCGDGNIIHVGAPDAGAEDGQDGLVSLISTDVATAETCPAGGVVVSTGLDLDGDGQLEDDEVSDSQPLCNGEDGEDGTDGEDGSSCSVVDNGDGTKTLSCEDGTEVTVSDGAGVPLVRATREPKGQNCELGGNRIELGLDLDDDRKLSDEEVRTLAYACQPVPLVTSVVAGGEHNCALFDNGSVKCWGRNADGQLGLGDTSARGDAAGEMGDDLPSVDLGTDREAVALVAGGYHNCALLDDGSVKCWGYNGFGALGLGDGATRGDAPGEMGDSLPAVNFGTGRTAVTLAAGVDHSCALLDDGSVKCWGRNSEGHLGLGDIQNHGDAAGEMGDSLPSVDFGSGRTAVAIALGLSHSCALLDDTSVKCWGYNVYGQLGLGDTVKRGDGPGEMGDKLPAVSLGAGHEAVAIASGWNHSCALLDDGSLKCWGRNTYGALGLGDTAARGDAAGEMGESLAAVKLGTNRMAVATGAGGYHSCALLDGGRVRCWGYNGVGQLGLGDTNDRGDAASEMGDGLPELSLGKGRTAAAIAVGNGHGCALLDNGRIKCWGYNGHGELGLGDANNRGDHADEMGDTLPFISLW